MKMSSKLLHLSWTIKCRLWSPNWTKNPKKLFRLESTHSSKYMNYWLIKNQITWNLSWKFIWWFSISLLLERRTKKFCWRIRIWLNYSCKKFQRQLRKISPTFFLFSFSLVSIKWKILPLKHNRISKFWLNLMKIWQRLFNFILIIIWKKWISSWIRTTWAWKMFLFIKMKKLIE